MSIRCRCFWVFQEIQYIKIQLDFANQVGEVFSKKGWYSSTNKGGLSRENSAPFPLIKGLICVTSWPRVFPRRLSDSLLSRHGGGYPDPHHSTKRALRDIRSIWLVALPCHNGRDWHQKIIGTVPASITKVVGLAAQASPVICEITARADQRPRKPGREAVPNHSERDRPTRIIGITASLISLGAK